MHYSSVTWIVIHEHELLFYEKLLDDGGKQITTFPLKMQPSDEDLNDPLQQNSDESDDTLVLFSILLCGFHVSWFHDNFNHRIVLLLLLTYHHHHHYLCRVLRMFLNIRMERTQRMGHWMILQMIFWQIILHHHCPFQVQNSNLMMSKISKLSLPSQGTKWWPTLVYYSFVLCYHMISVLQNDIVIFIHNYFNSDTSHL